MMSLKKQTRRRNFFILISTFVGLANATPGYGVLARSVSVGSMHSCALTAERRALCWGNDQTAPVYVSGSILFSQISSGGTHNCGLTAEGRAYCWGEGYQGEFGNGCAGQQPTPCRVLGDFVFSKLSSGSLHTCGLTREGQVACWGDNDFGQLGTSERHRSGPALVETDLFFSEMSAGKKHTCALTKEGEAYCWGFEKYIQLGISKSSLHVRRIPGDLRFSAISAGGAHTCALTAEGRAYCWGEGSSPSLVSDQLLFTQISSGSCHTCALTQEGRAYCWGDNWPGRLGTGDTDRKAAPTRVAGNLLFSQISSGSEHTCAVTQDGHVYCWGQGHFGQLGNGDTEDRISPTLILEPTFSQEETLELIVSGTSSTLNPKLIRSDLAQLIQLFVQRVKSDHWLIAYREGATFINVENKPPRELIDPSAVIYRITDPQFSNEVGLLLNTDYRIGELTLEQKEAVHEALYDLPPYPFMSHLSNIPNPEFDPAPLDPEDQKKIAALEDKIKSRVLGLPTPDPAHLKEDTYYDHRVGVLGNDYDRMLFLQILLAMKEGDPERFVEGMARLAACFPAQHAQAKIGLIYTMTHLYVTGSFPSLGIKKTYYHFLLRCGQIA